MIHLKLVLVTLLVFSFSAPESFAAYQWKKISNVYYCISEQTTPQNLVVDASFCPPIETFLNVKIEPTPSMTLMGRPSTAQKVQNLVCQNKSMGHLDPLPIGPQTQFEIWSLKDRGLSAQAAALQLKLEHYMNNAQPIDIKPLGGGITKTYLVTYPNGVKGVFKPKDGGQYNNEHLHEIAAFKLDQEFNLNVTPTTLQRSFTLGNTHKFGSLQFFMVGRSGSVGSSTGGPNLKIRIFDYIMTNCDRHLNNFLVGQGRYIAIDHGFAFNREYCELVIKSHASGKSKHPLPSFRSLDITKIPRPDNYILKSLENTSDSDIENALYPYLKPNEIQSVILRKKEILKKFPTMRF